MIVRENDAAAVYHMAEKADVNELKSLTTDERRIVHNIFKSIIDKQSIDQPIAPKQLSSIQAKLTNKEERKEKTFFEKVGNFFSSLFGLRISTQKLFNELQQTKSALAASHSQLKAINEKYKNIEVNTAEIKELIRFKNEFAAGKYAEMANLYASIGSEKEGKEKIAEKIKVIEEEIRSLQPSDPDLGSKQQILEKELLNNLKKMSKCEGGKWEMELKVNKDVWKKIADATKKHGMEEEILAKNEKQMSELIKEKQRLANLVANFS